MFIIYYFKNKLMNVSLHPAYMDGASMVSMDIFVIVTKASKELIAKVTLCINNLYKNMQY